VRRHHLLSTGRSAQAGLQGCALQQQLLPSKPVLQEAGRQQVDVCSSMTSMSHWLMSIGLFKWRALRAITASYTRLHSYTRRDL
jgi:hypothetical protein